MVIPIDILYLIVKCVKHEEQLQIYKLLNLTIPKKYYIEHFNKHIVSEIRNKQKLNDRMFYTHQWNILRAFAEFGGLPYTS